MTTIHIEAEALGVMGEAADQVARSLNQIETTRRFDLAPHVSEAHDDLADRWDRHRGELATNLSDIGRSTLDVSEQFAATDLALAESLDGSSTNTGQAS
jgi:hypothetical protein